jgi:hypothetical protein
MSLMNSKTIAVVSFHGNIDKMLVHCISQVHGTSTPDLTFVYYAYQNEITVDSHTSLKIEPTVNSKKHQTLEAFCPLFGRLASEIIVITFKNTTQYACLPSATLLKKVVQSPRTIFSSSEDYCQPYPRRYWCTTIYVVTVSQPCMLLT